MNKYLLIHTEKIESLKNTRLFSCENNLVYLDEKLTKKFSGISFFSKKQYENANGLELDQYSHHSPFSFYEFITYKNGKKNGQYESYSLRHGPKTRVKGYLEMFPVVLSRLGNYKNDKEDGVFKNFSLSPWKSLNNFSKQIDDKYFDNAESIYTFKDGSLHGFTFKDEGQFGEKGYYLNNQKNSFWEEFYCPNYHKEKNSKYFLRGCYLEDKKEGIWKIDQMDGSCKTIFYKNDQEIKEINFETVEVDEKYIVERNGLKFQVNKDIPFTGFATTSYKNGQWKTKKEYLWGKLKGISKKYKENGEVISKKTINSN